MSGEEDGLKTDVKKNRAEGWMGYKTRMDSMKKMIGRRRQAEGRRGAHEAAQLQRWVREAHTEP